MDHRETLEWIAEHVTAIRMLTDSRCNLEWVDEQGFACSTQGPDTPENTCLEALCTAVNEAALACTANNGRQAPQKSPKPIALKKAPTCTKKP